MSFDHNDHYHRLLLRQMPPGCATALDVGCGTGRFARRLSGLGVEVDAIDRSEEVIARARALSEGSDADGRPRFRQADVTETGLPTGRYDFISCLASLHHMPFGTVATLRDALAPGGVLAILGCYRETTVADLAWSLTAVPVNAAARLGVAVGERARATPGAAGRGRGALEQGAVAAPVRAPVTAPLMSLPEIRREAAALLPGHRLRRLLFWRYLLVFRGAAAHPPPPA
ncbi:class I SAM-dependent methyltransferase [Streptomyces sp. 6N223]|uniref:class I SAM-dependent methyltransferase n=1 Tax=Streptomyces sp. 6N223 TaxID=3457412 RepID=UPI003FD43D3E